MRKEAILFLKEGHAVNRENQTILGVLKEGTNGSTSGLDVPFSVNLFIIVCCITFITFMTLFCMS